MPRGGRGGTLSLGNDGLAAILLCSSETDKTSRWPTLLQNRPVWASHSEQPLVVNSAAVQTMVPGPESVDWALSPESSTAQPELASPARNDMTCESKKRLGSHGDIHVYMEGGGRNPVCFEG